MAVTPADVKRIIEYDEQLIPDAQPFIDDAVTLLSSIFPDDYPPTTMDVVTRYMAAHLIAITDPRVASEQVKSLQTSYQYRLDKGLGITMYGATAMMLDSSGLLAQWNNKVNKGLAGPKLFWAGGCGE